MKSQLLIAGILSTYALGAVAQPSTSSNNKICTMFQSQHNPLLIAKYSAKLEDGSSFCAVLSRTDDSNMIQMILYRLSKNGEKDTFGVDMGEEEQLFLIFNPADSGTVQKSYVGVSCNSSNGCHTGENFAAMLESDSLQLFMGEYSHAQDSVLSFLPEEMKNGMILYKNK